MAKCIQCGSEMYTSPASFKCFGCAGGYKTRIPTSSPVVPSDCVSQSALRKLVEEAKIEAYEGRPFKHWMLVTARRFEKLLEDNKC